MDWQALRFAYAETPNFDPLGAVTSSKRKKMFAAYAARDYATALARRSISSTRTIRISPPI